MAEAIAYKFDARVWGVQSGEVSTLVMIDLGNSVTMTLPVDPEVKPKVGTMVTIKVEIPMEKTDD